MRNEIIGLQSCKSMYNFPRVSPTVANENITTEYTFNDQKSDAVMY